MRPPLGTVEARAQLYRRLHRPPSGMAAWGTANVGVARGRRGLRRERLARGTYRRAMEPPRQDTPRGQAKRTLNGCR